MEKKKLEGMVIDNISEVDDQQEGKSRCMAECIDLNNKREVKTGEKDSEPRKKDPDNDTERGGNYRSARKEKLSVEMVNREDCVICYYCGENRRTKKELREHIFGVHIALSCVRNIRNMDEGKIHKQSYLKTFNQESALGNVYNNHIRGNTYRCEICEYKFSRKQGLRRHLVVHTGEKLFECNLCKKRFSQAGHLKRHMLIHAGEKAFECHVCKKRFSVAHNLRRHMHTHSGKKKLNTIM